MKRYFITGTNTDCGKTYASSQLTKTTPRSVAIKPVASGCRVINGQLVSADALVLQEHNHYPLSLEEINPWRFKPAISPHIAARRAGACLNIKAIADYCLNIQLPEIDTLFIEGAGGLMAPLNDEETWVDFLQYANLPIILVVGMSLGCLNHALLTAAVIKEQGIRCEGWIANCLDPKMQVLTENKTILKNKLPFPLLATIPFGHSCYGCSSPSSSL